MSIQASPTPNPETQAMLDCLRQTVTKTLDRKRRLGQYVVQWSGNIPVVIGEDAPMHLKVARESAQD